MPLQNRVLATGEIVSDPARGMFMGNRGILHDDNQTLGHARWKHKAWVTCVLKHKNWHRKVMQPGAYTELFFLDEAVALAAGHRPCAMCRNADYKAFRTATGWKGSAASLDTQTHAERAEPRTFRQRRHEGSIDDLPDGVVVWRNEPVLIWNRSFYPILPDGYGPKRNSIEGEVQVLTPPTTVAALHNGYRPTLHPSL